jgi:hypothetical protein
MDLPEMMEGIRKVCPNATFDTDNDGQVIIYTDKTILTSLQNPSIPAGEDLIVDFDPLDNGHSIA